MPHHPALFSLVLLITALLPLAAGEPRRPNIVVIMASDLGYADLGCHGCKDIATPHIDALAKGGARCTDGYAAAPVDGPTRAALLTGRFPQRFGFEFNFPRDAKEEHGLPVSQTTLADVVKDAGYATGMVGQWHLGQAAKYHPLRRGFQEFFGFLGGAHYYLKPEPAFHGIPTTAVWPNSMMRGTKVIEEKDYLTDAFTREAVDFIGRQGQKPFFLLLSYNAPQAPLEAPEKYLKRVQGIAGGDHRRRVYTAMIAAMDDGVGAVMTKLKDAGVAQDSLVFFLSGNGGITGYLSPSSNAPLIGTKSEVLEGGVRVPFLVHWPARIPAGVVYEQPVSVLDIFLTAVSASKAKLPADHACDGVDLVPHLAGKVNTAPHPILYWRYGPAQAVREGRYKLVRIGKDPPQLYDLPADPGESRDLAKRHPDVVQRLESALSRWNAELVAPAWNKPNVPPWW